MDLSSSYLGLRLSGPVVPGASPLTGDLDSIRRLEDAGAPAVVLSSLFEEQVAAEALGHEGSPTDPDRYLQQVRAAKEAVAIPVVASLNGTTDEGWLSFTRLVEQAGADALELNIYHIPVSADVTGEQVEQQYVELVKAVRAEVRIPVAVKLGPYFSSLANMAQKLDATGVDGLVLFNRFYQPDYDLESLEVVPNLILSNSHELLLRLHWIAVLYGSVKADMALTGGVHCATDVVKAMMAGAKVAMMTSALLKRGISYLDTLSTELLVWMGEHEYDSIRQMQGSMSRNAVPQPKAFERANYVKVLSSYAMR